MHVCFTLVWSKKREFSPPFLTSLITPDKTLQLVWAHTFYLAPSPETGQQNNKKKEKETIDGKKITSYPEQANPFAIASTFSRSLLLFTCTVSPPPRPFPACNSLLTRKTMSLATRSALPCVRRPAERGSAGPFLPLESCPVVGERSSV